MQTEDNMATEQKNGRYEKLFMMLFESIPSSILFVNRDMRVTLANRNFLTKSRRSSAETVGRRLSDVIPKIILEQFDIIKKVGIVFSTNVSTAGQKMHYRAPGLPSRVYYYRLLPFAWQREVEQVVLLMDDVTEQVQLNQEVRRIERHLASVVESASDIVFSTDVRGRILSWNRAAEDMSGICLEEIKGKMFSSIFVREDRQEVKSVFETMQSGHNSAMGEWALITKTGTPLHVSWVCSPMKDEYGQFMGLVAVGRDLTERRKLEMQLVQSQKFAALGVMAGGIAHEIRNPIAICSSAAQFLVEDDVSSEFRQECAQKIFSGIERASNIIENLLRFARPSTHEQVRWIELSALIEETVALIMNQAKIQKVAVNFQGDEHYSSWVFGNAGLLQQVFLNIFLNAIKAMPYGGNLDIRMWKTEQEIKASVADTGRGMSQEEMHKIFDPFYTTSPVGQGTGLGLAVSYSIIQQHSGSIEVDSVFGRGSTLIVSLPLGEEMFRRQG